VEGEFYFLAMGGEVKEGGLFCGLAVNREEQRAVANCGDDSWANPGRHSC
jgi:hypothetical protein